MSVQSAKCPQINKPKATVAKTRNSIGDRNCRGGGQFSSGQTKPAWRCLFLTCNTGQIEQRTCLVLVVLSRWPMRSLEGICLLSSSSWHGLCWHSGLSRLSLGADPPSDLDTDCIWVTAVIIWSGYGLGGYIHLGIRMKQTNISVDATENSKAHYNCSKNSKHLHIQVHLRKLEYGEKVYFFLVTYFKKWNFHIF